MLKRWRGVAMLIRQAIAELVRQGTPALPLERTVSTVPFLLEICVKIVKTFLSPAAAKAGGWIATFGTTGTTFTTRAFSTG